MIPLRYPVEINRLEEKVALLQRDLDNVEYNQGISIGQTQSAINVIMSLTGVNFEQAKQMIV